MMVIAKFIMEVSFPVEVKDLKIELLKIGVGEVILFINDAKENTLMFVKKEDFKTSVEFDEVE